MTKPNPETTQRKRAESMQAIAARLDAIDGELIEIGRELRAAQPKRPGSITLGFFGCGDDCLGCPHPRWQVWGRARSTDRHVRETVLVKHFVARASKRVRRTGDFAERAPIVRALIARADKLLKKRKTILAHLGAAQKALHY